MAASRISSFKLENSGQDAKSWKTTRATLFFYCISFLFFCGGGASVSAGDFWRAEQGASSMKMLSMPISPRSAALAGAGIASPQSAGEVLRNPLAGLSDQTPALGFSKINFSDKIGASHIAMTAHTPLSLLGGLHLTAGLESLNYESIQGYDEDGLTEDNLEYSAGTIAAQIGVAKKFKQSGFAVNARYANQNIDTYYYSGFLFDGGANFELNENLSFGAIFTNFGFISGNSDGSSKDRRETPPFAVQAGITASHSLPANFSASLSADLYRRNDAGEQWRLGGEFSYKDLFSARIGRPISTGNTDNDAISAGFALNVGFVFVEYAYANKSALDANHIFGIGMRF